MPETRRMTLHDEIMKQYVDRQYCVHPVMPEKRNVLLLDTDVACA